MALLNAGSLTLMDAAKRLDPDGKVATVVQLLAQSNPILQDMTWIEGNLPTGHRTTVQTGLPTVTFRAFNEGITPSKGTTAQIDEGCGMIEGMSEIDVDLALLNGNTAEYRMTENMGFIESMNQTMASTVFYGNADTAPKSFNGLSKRYNSLTGATSQNILNGAGSGSDNSSIWLVVWGPNTVTGIYPKGSKAGLVHEDLGEQIIQTGTGIATGRMKAYVDRWQWKCGVVVRDWRYAVRTCNIDISNLVAESSAADVVKSMVKMIHRIPSLSMGKPVFYCSRSVREMLDIQALNKASSQITLETFSGVPVTTFRGIPVRTCDQILETEATVS